jgi:hypothetical protein
VQQFQPRHAKTKPRVRVCVAGGDRTLHMFLCAYVALQSERAKAVALKVGLITVLCQS